MKTPVTPIGLRKYDDESPLEAVIKAWREPGPHPEHHWQAQRVVREAMPLLARALDRLPIIE